MSCAYFKTSTLKLLTREDILKEGVSSCLNDYGTVIASQKADELIGILKVYSNS